ncbi:cysteinyl-tRNA synthetase [Nitrolancea hollandica Lb]|uniref:Cysteine--tRNA ligase n=1 Tax=Nitrolancea hollandica Lb TaxID=1129897 RepID=I4ENB1_9BACT|nr:cysteine--tRNA ligase [Nitrolancea hollandica]CCF86174.1 cysteinyl-tRNA synthetase [Nitrolancea hollandica Lb]
MALKITNTLTGRKEVFEPLEPGRVRMYVCGPTVYSEAHIGHAMSAIIFDVIRRYLEYAGHEVTFVQNFTDIDDKIIQRAATLGIPPEELAERLIRDWLTETAALNIKPATIYPRATQEIDVIQEIIQGLINSGHAYAADGDVFYRVLSFPGYGKLSKRQIEEMLAGARVEVDPRKEHPMDFVLWKAAKPGEPAWESPWGPGRPGWHIECSAMIIHHLGNAIDIHGGGSDLIFPHHENEIAQSEAFLAQAPWVRYWIHNGLLQLGEEKMSKSLGNLISIRELLDRGGGEIFRFLVLSSHYRNPLTFTDESFEGAKRGLARLQGAVRGFQPQEVPTQPPDHPLAKAAESARQGFHRAMEDDFNTPVALAQLFDLAREINREEAAGTAPETVAYAQSVLKELAGVLGLTLREPERADEAIEPFVELLIAVRRDLRERKQWDLADQIRSRLTELGIALEDTAQGTTWRRA